MGRIALRVGALCVVVIAWLVPVPAGAVIRSLSPFGTDVGDCITAACRTFQYVINQSGSGDTILFDRDIDIGGGFGPGKITNKTLTLTGPFGGGIDNPGGDAITFNGGPNDELFVIDLNIDLGGTNNNGIRFNRGGKLNVIDSHIQGATGGASAIFFRPNTNSELNISNSNLNGNGTSGQGSAARIEPRNGANVKAVISDSFLSNNRTGITALAGAGSNISILVGDNTITGGRNGIVSSGSGSTIAVENSRITNNIRALNAVNGGGLLSVGSPATNTLFNNNINGSFTGTLPKQ